MNDDEHLFELHDDGELIFKNADSDRARGITAAMKRAIAKNSDEDRPEAFQPDAESEEEEAEAETPAERRARLRRLLAEADSRERRRNGATAPKRKVLTMDDLTGIADTICKRADAMTVAKLAAFETAQGGSRFSNFERASMIGAIAKASDQRGGSDDQRFSRFLQDPGNLLYRRWALLPPDLGELRKRDSLLDDEVTKTRAAGDDALGARAIGGREAFAAGTGSQGARPNAASRMIEQIIREKRTAAPWMSDGELRAYAEAMSRELERAARGTRAHQARHAGTCLNASARRFGPGGHVAGRGPAARCPRA
jgi:hypothetical protein